MRQLLFSCSYKVLNLNHPLVSARSHTNMYLLQVGKMLTESKRNKLYNEFTERSPGVKK